MNSLGILREIATNEIELIRTWRNNPKVRKNMYTRHEITPEEHLIWWGKIRERPDQEYLIYQLGESPMGVAAFTDIDLINENSSWAFYTSEDAPPGVGSKMEYLMLERAFSTKKLRKLYCEVLSFNEPVIRLHKKFGFSIEGVFRDQHKMDESFVDIYRLGLFATEWASKREKILERIQARSGMPR